MSPTKSSRWADNLCATLNSRSFASCNHKVSIPNVGAEVGTEEGKFTQDYCDNLF